jgi:hypothetical protein
MLFCRWSQLLTMQRFRFCNPDWRIWANAQMRTATFLVWIYRLISSVVEQPILGNFTWSVVGSNPTSNSRKLAQLVEQWSIKPSVTGSIPVLPQQTPALGMGTSLPTSQSGTGEIPKWFESSIFSLCCAGVLRHSVALGNGVPQRIVGQCDRLNPLP